MTQVLSPGLFGIDLYLFVAIILGILLAIGFGVLGMSLKLSTKRLGVVFPKLGKGFILYPSGFYDTKDIRPGGKDSFETPDHKLIFHAHNGTSYKSRTGGPTIVIVDPVSEFSQNARILNYILKLKSGVMVRIKSPDGKTTNQIRKFPTMNEAYLWYYEWVYIPKHNNDKAPKGWAENELKRVRAAKGVLAARNTSPDYQEEEIDWSNVPNPDAVQQTQQIQRADQKVILEPFPTRPMTDPEFDRLILDIAQLLVEEQDKILPEYYDGEALTLNDVASWMHSPAPENTLKGEYDRGYADGYQDRAKVTNDQMKYVLLICMIVMVGAIAYTIIAK